MKIKLQCPKCEKNLAYIRVGHDLWCGWCKERVENELFEKIYNEAFQRGENYKASQIREILNVREPEDN